MASLMVHVLMVHVLMARVGWGSCPSIGAGSGPATGGSLVSGTDANDHHVTATFFLSKEKR